MRLKIKAKKRTGGGDNGNKFNGAKPAIKELPSYLCPQPINSGVPQPIIDGLFDFSHLQSFFSAMEIICPELQINNNAYKTSWLGANNIVKLSRDNDNSHKGVLLFDGGNEQPVFIKRIHLLNPSNAMEGEYILSSECSLSAPREPLMATLGKINDPMNEAYVDALFASIASKLVESGISPHWCKCFGTLSGRVDKYLYDISDEYDTLKYKPWWKRNIKRGIFSIIVENDESDDESGDESGDDSDNEKITPLFKIASNDLSNDDFEELTEDIIHTTVSSDVSESDADIPECSGVMCINPPKLCLRRVSISQNNTGGSDSDESECDEFATNTYAEFTNYPVQISLLEYAEGTMDMLLDEEEPDYSAEKDARWKAWLFQIIAALNIAQYYFGFVHNDLHTSNVMWSTTNEPYLYYKLINGENIKYLRVPTFGRIMKIIDFGRASYHLPGCGGFIISDAFYPGNDAGTQYNCNPFYDNEKPRIEPNVSFDLSRLSVSLIESLYPIRPMSVSPLKIMSEEEGLQYAETESSVYNMLWSWLQDDTGRNVLRSPDGEERYGDFNLYRAIAADVHSARPSEQLVLPLFDDYHFDGDLSDIKHIYKLFL